MSDIHLIRLCRLEEELLPYGFTDGKYGELLYEAVEWVGIVDTVAFGFNIFVDGRLLASAEFRKDGQVNIDMQLYRWLYQESPISVM